MRRQLKLKAAKNGAISVVHCCSLPHPCPAALGCLTPSTARAPSAAVTGSAPAAARATTWTPARPASVRGHACWFNMIGAYRCMPLPASLRAKLTPRPDATPEPRISPRHRSPSLQPAPTRYASSVLPTSACAATTPGTTLWPAASTRPMLSIWIRAGLARSERNVEQLPGRRVAAGREAGLGE